VEDHQDQTIQDQTIQAPNLPLLPRLPLGLLDG
jgi:hypothetical protein